MNTQGDPIVGMTVAPTIASCIHPIMVTSTRQGSISFAPFAGGGDMRVAAVVLTTHSSSCHESDTKLCRHGAAETRQWWQGRHRRRVSTAINGMAARICTLRCILMVTVTSMVEWQDGLPNIGYSRAATCAFFTNLARWKFPYENHLIEISRESYNHLVCKRCPNRDPADRLFGRSP